MFFLIKNFPFNVSTSSIKSIFIIYKISCKSPDRVILFSQSEDTTLGTIFPFLVNLCTYFKINIITYEYGTKYNDVSPAIEKEKEMMKESILVTTYVSTLDNISSIDLFGVSAGSYLLLAAIPEQLKYKNKKFRDKLKHIVIVSPTWVFSPIFLRNSMNNRLLKTVSKKKTDSIVEALKQLQLPTLIAHGKKDNIVKYLLSISICAKLPNTLEWYPKNGNHYDLLDNKYRRKLYQKLNECLVMNNGVLGFKKTNNNYSLQNSGTGFDANLLSEMEKGMLNETDNMGYGNNDWSIKQTVDFGNHIQNSTNDEGTFKPTNTMQRSNNFVGSNIGSKMSEGFTFQDNQKQNFVSSFRQNNTNIECSFKPTGSIINNNNIECSFRPNNNMNNPTSFMNTANSFTNNNSNGKSNDDEVGSFKLTSNENENMNTKVVIN